MGYAIRDATHAIMPRMRLVCGRGQSPQEQSSVHVSSPQWIGVATQW